MSCENIQVKEHPAGGTLYSFRYVSKRLARGTEREVTVYIPKGNDAKRDLAVQVYTDGMRDCEPAVLDKLLAEKAVPPLVTIGVKPAFMPMLIPGGTTRRLRSIEYDSLGPKYADFIINELIPIIRVQILPRGTTLSKSADRHSMCGCSSGGICAWNACWERNDCFRRCLINSPTFSSFRGGEELLAYMRKFETKPIRCYMTAGTDDMRNSAGDWYLEALMAKEAMEYAGYEYEFELFEGGKHGVGSADADVMERGLRFIWKDWETKPVGIRHLPERVADIITADSPWIEHPLQDTPDYFPFPVPVRNFPLQWPGKPMAGLANVSLWAYTPYGLYTFSDGNINGKTNIIYLAKGEKMTRVAKLPFTVSGVALSCDRSLLYMCSTESRVIYAYRIAEDGTLHDIYSFARIHLAEDVLYKGVAAICVDDHDRLYAATALGIQTFSWEGHCNCVLTLPNNAIPALVGFSDEDPSRLCVVDLENRFYERQVLTRAVDDSVATKPGTPLF